MQRRQVHPVRIAAGSDHADAYFFCHAFSPWPRLKDAVG
jgi:hypothetical protein